MPRHKMNPRSTADAFGQQLLDYHRTGHALGVVERDDGYVDMHETVGYFAGYRKWSPRERAAMRMVSGRVLDIGCGAGRNALYLQNRCHHVWGIDTSPGAIRVCRERGVKHACLLSIDDVQRLDRTFDTVIMLGNNFGLFRSFRHARHLLARLRAVTAGSGRIIAESLDPYQSGAPHHRAYHRRNRRLGRMGGQVRIRSRYLTHIGPWFDYLLASKREIERIVSGTGWKVERYIDSGGAQSIVVLAKTPVTP